MQRQQGTQSTQHLHPIHIARPSHMTWHSHSDREAIAHAYNTMPGGQLLAHCGQTSITNSLHQFTTTPRSFQPISASQRRHSLLLPHGKLSSKHPHPPTLTSLMTQPAHAMGPDLKDTVKMIRAARGMFFIAMPSSATVSTTPMSARVVEPSPVPVVFNIPGVMRSHGVFTGGHRAVLP
jgi:hypothetical protein